MYIQFIPVILPNKVTASSISRTSTFSWGHKILLYKSDTIISWKLLGCLRLGVKLKCLGSKMKTLADLKAKKYLWNCNGN